VSAFQWAITGALSVIAVFIWWFCFHWLPRQPVDQNEDRAQSDRDVRQIVDSMRGTL